MGGGAKPGELLATQDQVLSVVVYQEGVPSWKGQMLEFALISVLSTATSAALGRAVPRAACFSQ